MKPHETDEGSPKPRKLTLASVEDGPADRDRAVEDGERQDVRRDVDEQDAQVDSIR